MGDGIFYRCNKCGNEYPIMLGWGMGYSLVYDEIMEKLLKGEFGEDLQKIVEKTKNIVVDAINYLYICGQCGYWTESHGLDLYQVKNEKLIEENADADKKWIDGWTFFEYRTHPKDFRVLKRIKYVCPECNSLMKRIGEHSKYPILKCPECHEDMVDRGRILWD